MRWSPSVIESPTGTTTPSRRGARVWSSVTNGRVAVVESEKPSSPSCALRSPVPDGVMYEV